MRPRRCVQERAPDLGALASRSRVASPQAGPLLRRARAHLVPVRALPDADFASFPPGTVCRRQLSRLRVLLPKLSHELVGQDTSALLPATKKEGSQQAPILSIALEADQARLAVTQTGPSCSTTS